MKIIQLVREHSARPVLEVLATFIPTRDFAALRPDRLWWELTEPSTKLYPTGFLVIQGMGYRLVTKVSVEDIEEGSYTLQLLDGEKVIWERPVDRRY